MSIASSQEPHAVRTAARTRRRLVALPRADTIAISVLLLLVAGLTAATWGTWGELDYDTGYDVQAAARIVDGELPYRDFLYFYGPLAPALGALVAAIGGSGFAPALALGFVIAFGIIAATYRVGRILAGPLAALLAAALTAAVAFIPDNYSYVLPHTGAATLGTLCLLAMLLAVHRYATGGGIGWAVTTGALLGLLLLTKPEHAAAGVAAVSVWLAVRHRTKIARRHELLAVALPAVSVPAAVYGLALLAVSPHRLLLENLYPEKFLAGSALVSSRLPLTVDSFVRLGGKLALYAGGTCAIFLAAKLLARGGRTRVLVAAAIAGAAALAVAASVARPDAMRHGLELVYGWIPAGAAIAAAIVAQRAWRKRDEPSAQRQLELVGVVGLAVLAATSYAGFFPHAPYEQIAVYAMPFAALFLIRLHLRTLATTRPAYLLGALWLAFLCAAGLGLTLKDARGESVLVRGPGGALAETPREAALYQGALTWIERSTGPGDAIFVAPLMPSLYTLSQRENPTEHLSLLPGSLAGAVDERALIDTLSRADVKLVVTDDRNWHVYGEGAFGETFDRELAAWIRDNYRQAAVLRAEPWHSFEGDIPARRVFIWLKKP